MSGPLSGGRHDWLGYLQPTGLVVAPAVLERLGLWPEPQGPADGRALADALAAFERGDPWPLFRDVLRWPAARVAGAPGGPPTPDLSVSLREGETMLAPDWVVADASGAAQLLVSVEPPATPLDRRGAADGWEATAHQRFERLLRETAVGAGVLLGWRETGRAEDPLAPELRLVTAPRGEQSGWVAWPLRALADVGGRGMLAGLKLLLDAHALFTGAASHRLPTMLAESRAAQADVSAKLSGQVLAALHELLRGFDAAAPALVRGLAGSDPHALYEGLLTVLLRLIFILYAEDRGLMPSVAGGAAASLYEQGYALGALHVRLRDDEAVHPDLMDERRGAWGRLLALFGLVERGEDGFMQARGGKLFDRRRFPFLLGRATPDDPELVLPVSDGCILRVLDGLMVLDGERLMYRALSVEQLGTVYEMVMGFTVEVAAAPVLAIRAGKGNRVPVWVDLAALARTPAGERARLLKERTARGQFGAAVTRALRTATTVAELEAALASIVDPRACPRGQAVAEGTPVLQPTDERRRTGSHYTPRSLTEPIVLHALAPAFARIGAEATPDAVLDLKVCDPACGSGAFLVEACRQLGDRLVAAWERWPAERERMRRQMEAEEKQLHVEDDDLTLARRLVARRCLYGVDRNPLALDLARLGLWLLTLARSRPFVFFEHALRSGDSLVGLPNSKIKAVTWGEVGAQRTFVERAVDDGLKAAFELRVVLRSPADELAAANAEIVQHEVERKLRHAHLIADALLEAFFSGTTRKERDRRTGEVQGLVLGPDAGSWEPLARMQDALHRSPIGIAPFHWELEFPEVFGQANPGFDAIVGNPPFAGKNTIASGHPLAYPDWLKTLHPGAHGNADLAAHFFRRAWSLLRTGGAFGLIATNTIRQGDTRESGLARIVADGGTIFRAETRHKWEGEAAVVVSQVFVAKGDVAGAPVLDGNPVSRISAYLVEGEMDGSPEALKANAGVAFAGVEQGCDGFLFSDKPTANPLTMATSLREQPSYRTVVQPYLGTEEVNTDPQHRHHRYAVNFGVMPLCKTPDIGWFSASAERRLAWLHTGRVPADYPDSVASDWPDLLALLDQKVRPVRESERWWQYRRAAVDMVAATEALGTVLVTSRSASPHFAIARVNARQTLAKTLAVFALSTHAAFATLQSRVHEVWARAFASTLEERLRYTPSDCFETFPLPPNHDDAPALEDAGRAYHDHRAALMIATARGMTPTYNRFHDPDDTAHDIAELRRLHAAMDRAVLAAYGWDDLAERAAPVFLDEENEGDHQYQGRLFWPAPFRDAVLARLLKLNEERGAAERRL